MPLTLRTVAHSEIGLVRKNNQDSGYASPTMVVVADGMGGAAAGDLASAVAVVELQKADGMYSGSEMLEVLGGALLKANDRLAELVADDHSLEGMGTTVCGALFDGSQLGIAHIGDSRGYLLRDGALSRLTHDHSWVQSLIDEGRITEDESHVHPHRSLLLRVLNGQPISEPDLELVTLQAGDRIMFCSDGLCGLVTDGVISDALAGDDLDHVLADLVEAAHAGGGLDNITIIVSDVVETGADELPATGSETQTLRRSKAHGLVLGAAAIREIPALLSRSVESTSGAAIETPGSTGAQEARAQVASQPVLATVTGQGYEPDTGHRRRRLGLWAAILAVVLVIGLAAYGTYAYAMTQFLVSPVGQQVGIYQGVQGSVLGISTNRLVENSGIQMSDLPPAYQEKVRTGITIRQGGLDSARAAVDELRTRAAQCVSQRLARAQATQTPTPAASASPSATSSAVETATSSPSPQGTASPGTIPAQTPTSVQSPSAPDEC